MASSPLEAAADLHEQLVEILRQLNRAEMEEPEGEGLELGELSHFLARRGYGRWSSPELARALDVLVGNGYARSRDDPAYAWDRGRMLGTRFSITTAGKSFLLERLARGNRVD